MRQAAPRIAYLVPDFQNPTGRLMPREQRVRVLETARATGTWLVIDETISDIALDVPRPAPFASLAPAGAGEQVATVGSLSKSHWGGLRIGWVRAGSKLVTELAMARVPVDMATPVIEQLVALHLLRGMDDVLRERLPAAGAAGRPGGVAGPPAAGVALAVAAGRPLALGGPGAARGVVDAPARARARRTDRGRVAVRRGHWDFPSTGSAIPYTLPPDLLEQAVARLAAASAGDLRGAGDDVSRRHWVA